MTRMVKAKSFEIAKREVWEAYKRVKANRGAAGVDGVTIAKFEQNLSKKPVPNLESHGLGQLRAAAGQAR